MISFKATHKLFISGVRLTSCKLIVSSKLSTYAYGVGWSPARGGTVEVGRPN